MSLQLLRTEMQQYYQPLRHRCIQEHATYQGRLAAIRTAMDAYAAAHPGLPACLLKARLHEEIAERCEPVIFRHSPFFFEMGVRFAENWGNPDSRLMAGSWLWARTLPEKHACQEWRQVRQFTARDPANPWQIWCAWNFFDVDHHSLGYTRLLREGVNGLLDRLRARREQGGSAEQLAFLDASERGLRALLRVAERFAARAEELLRTETDADARRCLSLIATAARRVPAQPPRNFHEGLAALLFLREAVASFENIGISVLGHVDRLLGPLLQQDLERGVLDEAGARDLLARWMPHTDVKFHVEDNEWPETSTCAELGGCDEDGAPVFNEVTRLFVEVHREHSFLNPKLNCRFGSSSPRAYLELLARHAAAGHNNFAFLNDDVLIPACVRAGKSEREARLYVNGGCQETICEGVEHSAGAYYYFNMARILDLYLRPVEGAVRDALAAQVVPEPAAQVTEFEPFYRGFVEALGRAVAQGAAWLRAGGQGWDKVHPCPLFSATLAGCIENARDYSAGGARHNPAVLALVGFATVVDSLEAIRRAVCEDRFCTWDVLRRALAGNWKGAEALRERLAALPKYGHGDERTDALAARLAADIVAFAKPLRNERGGPFLPSFFVYYFFAWLAPHVRATPDGRRDGELLSQGVSPGRVRAPEHLPDIIHALSKLDLRDFPGNAVLDLQWPVSTSDAGAGERLAATVATFGRLGGATLQPNCVSAALLREAQAEPDRHRDLIVRISGLSARFVALTKEVQEEIIARTTAGMRDEG